MQMRWDGVGLCKSAVWGPSVRPAGRQSPPATARCRWWQQQSSETASDFFQEEKYSGGSESYGKQWTTGDVVGVFLDLIDHTISKFAPTHSTGFYNPAPISFRTPLERIINWLIQSFIALCFHYCSSCTMAHVMNADDVIQSFTSKFSCCFFIKDLSSYLLLFSFFFLPHSFQILSENLAQFCDGGFFFFTFVSYKQDLLLHKFEFFSKVSPVCLFTFIFSFRTLSANETRENPERILKESWKNLERILKES